MTIGDGINMIANRWAVWSTLNFPDLWNHEPIIMVLLFINLSFQFYHGQQCKHSTHRAWSRRSPQEPGTPRALVSQEETREPLIVERMRKRNMGDIGAPRDKDLSAPTMAIRTPSVSAPTRGRSTRG